MAQEMKNQNTNRKIFFIFNKELKKIMLKKTTIGSENFLEIETSQAFKSLTVNNKDFFYQAISALKLKKAWYQLKSNQSKPKENLDSKIVENVKNSWFENINQSLLNGTFRYPEIKKVITRKSNFKSLNFVNPKIKIIERSLLNYLEAIFEGVYIWISISEKEFKNARKKFNIFAFKNEFKVVLDQKTKKQVFKKKHYVIQKIFKPTNFGFRTDMSAHQAFYYIKTMWSKNTTYFLDYGIINACSSIDKKILKNVFNRYILDSRVWEEIEKMLNIGYIQDDILQVQNSKVKENSILSFFLFNIYLHDFDQYMEDLNQKNIQKDLLANSKTSKTNDINYMNKSIQYIRYGNEVLIGLTGTRKFALNVQKKINSFLNSNLLLTTSKNRIFYKNQFPIMFLDHKIKIVNLPYNNSFIDKQLKIIRKFRDNALQKIKLEECRVARIKKNKLRIEILKFIDVMSRELNLSHTKRKDFDLLVSLFAYKFLGDILAKTLNLNNFEKLVNFLYLLNYDAASKNFSLRKLNVIMNNTFIYKRTNILSRIILQIDNFKHLNSYQAENVSLMLTELQNLIQIKTKAFSNSIIVKYIEKLKSAFPSSVVEKKDFQVLAGNLINFSFQKQHTNFISIKADIKKLCDKLRSAGFIHLFKNQASSCYKVLFMSEIKIIKYYNFVMREILNWFSGVDNFFRIKGIMESVMRRSCLLTLKRKFKLKSMSEAISVYTKNISITTNNTVIVKLITKEEILKIPNIFNINVNTKLSSNKENFNWEKTINKLIY
jgi:Type II intron maturase